MRRAPDLAAEMGAVPLLEAAAHLLRSAPAAAWVAYAIGTLPCVLGLLYFCSDMSQSALAEPRLVFASAAMAVLYGWMKGWQTLFVRSLDPRLTGMAPPAMTVRQVAHVFAGQWFLHALCLFLVPIASIVVIPLGWVVAWQQNVTALAWSQRGVFRLRTLTRESWVQACRWPIQNHTFLTLVTIVFLVVMVNLLIAGVGVPFLLKTLLGVETAITRNPVAALNTTFFTAILGATYILVNPLLHAAYLIRCFQGESIRSGADLRASLRRCRIQPVLAVALLLYLTAPSMQASAAPGPVALAPDRLDASIEQVLDRREYLWRVPPTRTASITPETKQAAWWEHTIRWVKARMQDLETWLRQWRRTGNTGGANAGGGSPLPVTGITLFVILLLLGLVVVLIAKFWKRKAAPAGELIATGLALAPDLSAAHVEATLLPEDQWLELARVLWAKGELRLALRAYYLSALAHLAERQFIQVARFKSNHDYVRELERRRHVVPHLIETFSWAVTQFDRSWYGPGQVDEAALQLFSTQVERIREC